MMRRKTKTPTTSPAMKNSCQRCSSVRPWVVAPEYSPKPGSLHPVRRSEPPTSVAAASHRERRRGGVIGVVEPGASAEVLVTDESTAVRLSNPAEKDEVAAQGVTPDRNRPSGDVGQTPLPTPRSTR